MSVVLHRGAASSVAPTAVSIPWDQPFATVRRTCIINHNFIYIYDQYPVLNLCIMYIPLYYNVYVWDVLTECCVFARWCYNRCSDIRPLSVWSWFM